MGMYDRVYVPCPRCGKRAEFQSKSGPCDLDTYLLEDCPQAVLADVNRHAPATCDAPGCGVVFYVVLSGRAEFYPSGLPDAAFDGDG